MSIPGYKTFLLVMFKVISQGQGQISRSQFLKKMAVAGGISVSQTQLVLDLESNTTSEWLYHLLLPLQGCTFLTFQNS